MKKKTVKQKTIDAVLRFAHCIMFVITLLLFVIVVVPFAGLDKSIRKTKKEKPRIVWGCTPIISAHYGSMAVRLYRYKSVSVVYEVYHLHQKLDFDYVVGDYIEKIAKKGTMLYRVLISLFSPYAVFFLTSLKFDIFHFYFDRGFLPPTEKFWLEFQLLHLAGKKIIVTPYGGDARLESITKKHRINFCLDCTSETKWCDENKIRRRVEYICKHADIVLGCADLVDTLPCWHDLFLFPIDVKEWLPVPFPDNLSVKVVHASNHRMYKGTRFLVSAIEELKSKGYQVELVLVEKVPNSEAKKIYEHADIIADQFIGGAYAQFAIEGMALGKPVMCYLREDLFKLHPEWSECPIVNTNPDNLKENLIMLIKNRQLRQDLGQKGVVYTQKYHSLEAVGLHEDKIYRKLWSIKENK